MLIQYLLILAVCGFFAYFLRHHGTTRVTAGTKLCFVGFLGFTIYAVLRPDDVSELARWLGVGRGTDLLVYALATGFAFASINTFLRFKEFELRYARFARFIALRDATSRPTPELDDLTSQRTSEDP